MMRDRMRAITRVLLAGLIGQSVVAVHEGAAAQSLQMSFDLAVPSAPTPVPIDGRTHLVYELHLTNFTSADLRLTRMEVLDAARAAPALAVFDDSSLVQLLGRVGVQADTADKRVIRPGMRAVAYFWIPLSGSTVPSALKHRITFGPDDGSDPEGVVEGGRVDVRVHALGSELGAPLRGGPWVAVYHPELERGHRRVLFAHDGSVRIPARFTIDWMRVDAHGRLADGDASVVTNYYGYGADVLAVADATVVAVRDAIADRTTIAHVRHGLENASGNHITLDLGDGRFVSYEHLRAGSIRVAPGDHVRCGQTIAQLGYSGDASRPHLHMHVSDGPAPLAGEGVPYTFEEFVLLGSYPSIAAFAEGGAWTLPAAGTTTLRHRELPAPNRVVTFRGTGPRCIAETFPR